MRLWFSRGSEISIRDQLATQIMLSILSGELVPGQRLPSTRELARRFHLHANTVSAGYRQLERGNWVEFRKGSGIYVSQQKPGKPSSAIALDQIIGSLFQSALELEIPLEAVRSRLRQWLELQPPDHFLLIEPDSELARIAVAEMRKVLRLPIKTCGIEKDRLGTLAGAIPAALSTKAPQIRSLLPPGMELLTLNLRSAGDSLAAYLPAPSTALIGVASSWPAFLKNARTMLIAAGFHPDCLVLRNASEPKWQRGLKQTAAVICDTLTAQELNGSRVMTFPILAESSLKDLREYEHFILSPLSSQM
jgi:DNA-binding transcriptional regulator YhcF (GntR family)